MAGAKWLLPFIFSCGANHLRPYWTTPVDLPLANFIPAGKRQAMPVLIHSARRGKNPAVIFPSALLVEGSAPKPP